jgi:hypothetical protein
MIGVLTSNEVVSSDFTESDPVAVLIPKACRHEPDMSPVIRISRVASRHAGIIPLHEGFVGF